MGVPKQRWTSEEEAALRAGIARHGVGKWRTILKDPEFSSTLSSRSNVDLKDKWRNMNVIVSTSSSRDKGKNAVKRTRTIPPKNNDHTVAFSTVTSDIDDGIVDEKHVASVPSETHNTSSSRDKGKNAVKRTRTTPKNNDHTVAVSTVTSSIDDGIVDEKHVASVPSETQNTSNPKKAQSRLDNIIMEAIKSLNEPTGSHRTTIANYIEEQYWPPSDFDHLLSAKLKDLATSGKLIKVNRKYRIAPSSPNSEGRSPKMLLLEDVQRAPIKIGNNDSRTLTRSQVDAELAHIATMTAEEASAAAARAVAEAEAIMAEAEAAAREAEAAEADAQAAQAFAEAAFLTLKNRNTAKLMAQA